MFELVEIKGACSGQSNGEIKITAANGKSPYSISAKNASFSMSSDIGTATNVAAATYSVTITDNEGCSSVQEVEVDNSGGMDITAEVRNVCDEKENDGSISLNVTSTDGSDDNFTYAWSNNSTDSEVSGLAVGTYSVVVTNEKGCSATRSYEVKPRVALDYQVTDITGSAGADGKFVLALNKGAFPITYSLDPGNITGIIEKAETRAITDLASGKYQLILTDANGCTK